MYIFVGGCRAYNRRKAQSNVRILISIDSLERGLPNSPRSPHTHTHFNVSLACCCSFKCIDIGISFGLRFVALNGSCIRSSHVKWVGAFVRCGEISVCDGSTSDTEILPEKLTTNCFPLGSTGTVPGRTRSEWSCCTRSSKSGASSKIGSRGKWRTGLARQSGPGHLPVHCPSLSAGLRCGRC